MNTKPDPFGLNLLFDLVKGNKAAAGCVILLMEIVTLTIFARVLWQILSQTLPAQIAIQWTIIVNLGVFGIYGLIRLVRFLRSPMYDQENQLLSITTFVFALILGVLGFLMLNGIFDSSNSEAPDATFFLLFYSLPLGGMVVISVNVLLYLQARRSNGLMIASTLISLPILAIFFPWHFLALGLSGDYYPCLVDAMALMGLVVLVVVSAKRNRANA